MPAENTISCTARVELKKRIDLNMKRMIADARKHGPPKVTRLSDAQIADYIMLATTIDLIRECLADIEAGDLP
jgi:hypothetical protein